MFTGVMKQYLAIRSDGAIAELNAFLAQLLDCPPEAVYEALEDLLSCLLPKKALHEYGMQEHELAEFTDSVLANQQRLLQNNFVPPLPGADLRHLPLPLLNPPHHFEPERMGFPCCVPPCPKSSPTPFPAPRPRP